MKTIQITIDEKLLSEVDRALKGRRRSRSAFIRESIVAQLKLQKRKRLEERDRAGYLKYPVEPDEFYVDPSQLDWGDEWEWKSNRRGEK